MATHCGLVPSEYFASLLSGFQQRVGETSLMIKLVPIEVDENTVVYLELDDAVVEPPRGSREAAAPIRKARGNATEGALRRFGIVDGSVSAFVQQTLDAFRGVANANVEKVTLEFGINVSGEAGIPYITKARGEGNLSVKVECSFPGNGVPEQITQEG